MQEFSQKAISAEAIHTLQGKRVLVVGDLMLDAYCFGDAERISPEAPVPVVKVEEEQRLLGGAGNVARNIAALGGLPTLAGITGKDHEGECLHSLLIQGGISPCLVTSSDRPTTVKTRILARRQQMLRLDREDSRALDQETTTALLHILADVLPEHEVLILSDYNKGLITPFFMQGLWQILHKIGENNIRVLIDPKPANVSLYSKVFLLTPNTKETGECAKMPVRTPAEILAAGRRILRHSECKHLLTTLGSEGMALFLSQDEVWHLPTTARAVFDVTGAGDTVIATLSLCLAAGFDLLPACVLANYAAGLVVAKVGAATVSQKELITAIDNLPKIDINRWA